MRRRMSRLLVIAVLLVGLLAMAPPLWAQFLDRLGGGRPGGAALEQETAVTVEGQFTVPTKEVPARLFITAQMAPDWHVYSITQAPGGPKRTKIKLDPSKSYELLGDFEPYPRPEKKKEGIWLDPNLITETHHDSVTWYAPITLAAGVDPAGLQITGQVYAQACHAQRGCRMPEDFRFAAVLGSGIEVPRQPSLDVGKLIVQLCLALLGGLILNLMPCVLPVISLKLMSFLDQAGESRARVFALNVWYALGLLSVFMVLAMLAASAGLAWGEQFTLPWFKVTMIGLVFVMALSFLGVWEIPIPGFVGSGQAGKLQVKEGAGGAFFKGVFATILATPCSGPFLGPVFGYLLEQPPFVAYWVFGAVALGMASPYLLVGAFPRLIRFLPRPGPWMDTFKQLMGFFLLGTVVYLFSATTEKYFVPTLALLVGLWFGCWLIGRTPLTASPQHRLTVWAGGILAPILVGLFAFTVLFWEPIIPWRPFSPEALAVARAEGKTVMVDFTADWCPNCKTNSKVAIEREEVLAVVEKNRVVPLLADWTDESPVIKRALNDLGANSIPVLAIWPPGGEAIVLKDLLTKGQVVDALTKAGPSKPQPRQDQGSVALSPQ